MAIGSIELRGMDLRMTDFSAIKHNEEQKGMVDQQNFQVQFEKHREEQSQKIERKNNPESGRQNKDARQKGSNSYQGDGGANRNSKNKDGKVIVKGNSSFDVKI